MGLRDSQIIAFCFINILQNVPTFSELGLYLFPYLRYFETVCHFVYNIKPLFVANFYLCTFMLIKMCIVLHCL